MLEARPTGRPITLVSAMMNIALADLYVHTVEDGMRLHAWKEPQLAVLQAQLKDVNLLPYVAGALSVELAGTTSEIEITPKEDLGKLLHQSDSVAVRWTLRLVPQGWVYQNLVVLANLKDLWTETVDPTAQRVYAGKIETVNRTVDEAIHNHSPFNYLAAVAMPNFARAVLATTHNQSMVNQARIACALERYRLVRGEYPPALDALVPQFIASIPSDVIGGQPPRYDRTDNGKFLLYSIGWTERDHGGHASSNIAEGDWVWMADF